MNNSFFILFILIKFNLHVLHKVGIDIFCMTCCTAIKFISVRLTRLSCVQYG